MVNAGTEQRPSCQSRIMARVMKIFQLMKDDVTGDVWRQTDTMMKVLSQFGEKHKLESTFFIGR
eukprot:1052568-Rhodomonas_salina.1